MTHLIKVIHRDEQFKASCVKKVEKKTSKEFENILTGIQFDINKHNQKLINILENQKIYGDFFKILFRISLSRNHLQSKTFLKVEPEKSGFWENLHRSFGFPIR